MLFTEMVKGGMGHWHMGWILTLLTKGIRTSQGIYCQNTSIWLMQQVTSQVP